VFSVERATLAPQPLSSPGDTLGSWREKRSLCVGQMPVGSTSLPSPNPNPNPNGSERLNNWQRLRRKLGQWAAVSGPLAGPKAWFYIELDCRAFAGGQNAKLVCRWRLLIARPHNWRLQTLGLAANEAAANGRILSRQRAPLAERGPNSPSHTNVQ